MKRLFVASFMGLVAMCSYAQSSTNSPYSQFGLGTLSEPAGSANRGMNGLGLGFHEHNMLNVLNPASYSSIDSLTFLFDVGMSFQMTNFKEGAVQKNAKSSAFEYVMAGFRLRKNLGVSFGMVPYTNIGYSYSNSGKISEGSSTGSTTYTNTYTGDGGLRYVYLGIGWRPFKGLSIGVNGAYLWGEYDRYVVNSYSDSYANSLTKYYSAEVRNYKVDFGLQYTLKLSKSDELTLGVTYGLGHKLGSDPECKVISTNAQTSVSDTATLSVANGLEIPTSIAAGLMWNKGGKVKVGIDYSLEKWSSVRVPTYVLVAETPQYRLESGQFNDRHKLTIGGEITPNIESRKFLNRVRYRIGASYTKPYLNINGYEGPKEMSVSVGFGIPIINMINNRSLLNISAQWVHLSSNRFVTENSFRINIGLTFNERWFAKWKME